MDLAALGPEHLTALAYGGQAQEALALITEQASPRISTLFRPADERVGSHGLDYLEWWTPSGAPPGEPYPEGWLEWHVRRDRGAGSGEAAPRTHAVLTGSEQVLIRAGLCANRKTEFDTALQRKLEDGVEIDGEIVVFHRWRGESERLMRIGRPQEVLVGPTIETQAESLARWVAHSLEAVELTRRS